jgi:hypothetical protein
LQFTELMAIASSPVPWTKLSVTVRSFPVSAPSDTLLTLIPSARIDVSLLFRQPAGAGGVHRAAVPADGAPADGVGRIVVRHRTARS